MVEKRQHKLTVRTVEAAKARRADLFFWDDQLAGFGLRVKPSGIKTFIVQYRNKFGATRRLALGKFGELAPEAARRLAQDRLEEVRKGRDPSAERKDNRKALTVAELVDEFLEQHAEKKLKASTAAAYTWLAGYAIKPRAELGTARVPDLTRDKVARWHAALSATPTQANRALALLAKMLNWAITERTYRADGLNPAKGIKKHPESQRERFLSADEFKQLGAAITEAERKRTEPVHALAAIRLLALSGMRLSEVLNLKRSEVSRERGFLELGDSKTGRKAVPITAPLALILDGIPEVKDNDHIIAGRKKGQRLVGLHRVWWRIAKKAKLDGVRLHDLRHSAASVGASGGLSLPIIGALLGHSQPQTTQRYAHLAADPVKAAAETVATRVAGMMAGHSAKVLPLKRKRRA